MGVGEWGTEQAVLTALLGSFLRGETLDPKSWPGACQTNDAGKGTAGRQRAM